MGDACEDGRFVTLGRASDPTDDEISRAGEALRVARTAGWLAVMRGNPYRKRAPEVMRVRPLGEPAGTFEAAVAAFQWAHAKRLS